MTHEQNQNWLLIYFFPIFKFMCQTTYPILFLFPKLIPINWNQSSFNLEETLEQFQNLINLVFVIIVMDACKL